MHTTFKWTIHALYYLHVITNYIISLEGWSDPSSCRGCGKIKHLRILLCTLGYRNLYFGSRFLPSVILPASVSYSKWSTPVCPILLSKKKILVHAQERLLIWFCAKISAVEWTNISRRLSQNKYNSHPSHWRNVGFICSVCGCVCAWTHACTHAPALPPAVLCIAGPSSLRLQWTAL